MSVITSLNKRAANLAQKALRLGGDFVHPVSDDSGNTPDYNDPNNIISPDGHIDLPHTVEWGEGFPSTTFLDPETGLLTTKTEGKPPLDEGTTIYDIHKTLTIAGANDIKICTLLLKPEVYDKALPLDYVAMEVENRFLVGFGLDYNQLGRNCKDIYILDKQS